MQLSKNFTFNELTNTSHTSLLEKNRLEAKEYLDNLVSLANDILEPLRDILKEPIYINSGFRGDALNAKVGGSKTSQHSFGEAVFDLGQTYKDVTASRVTGVTYTNNTGKAIEVLINIIVNNTTFTIDTLTTNAIANNSSYTTITATIPVGSTYKISSGVVLQKWFELR